MKQLRAVAFVCLLAAAARAQERGQLDANPAVFSVLAAVNAAGYDVGVDSTAAHPLRKAIRDEVARRKPDVVPEIRKYLASSRADTPAQDYRRWVSFALLVEDPPSFKFRLKENQLPPDVAAMAGFIPLMQRFHKEAGIGELFEKSRPYHDQILVKYQDPAIRAVNETAAYLRAPRDGGFLGRKFQIVIDLLGAPNQILSLSFLDEYYLVLTHSPEPHYNDLRQAYLHFLLDPVATKFGMKLEEKRALGDYAQGAPFLADHYKQDFLLLATKSLIYAVEARLEPLSRRKALVDQAMGQGFILTAHFYEQLPAYEKQEAAMRMYFADIIDAISLKREEQRLEKLEFSKTRVERKAKPAPPPPPRELPAWEKQIEEAEDLYTARKLDPARDAFTKVMTLSSEKSVHARSYYGLARIAALRNDPELADQLFRKSLELGPPPAEKAWVLYYLGRLSWVANEQDAALKYYRDALAVEGGSERLRQVTRKALDDAAKEKK